MAAAPNNGQIMPPNTPIASVGVQRATIAPEWYRYFVQRKFITDGIAWVSLLTIDQAQSIFPNSRQLTVARGELRTTASEQALEIGLEDSGVDAGEYGSPTHLVILAIDAKGRVTEASQVELNSDNVTEGVTNLFFTDARARGAVSGGAHISYNAGTGSIAFNGTGVSGTFAAPASITVEDGLITAVS